MDEPRKRGIPRTPPTQYRSPDRSDSGSPPPRNRSRSPRPPRTPPSPSDRDRSRDRGDRNGGRRGEFRGNRDQDDGRHFSNYYRSRFGSQSPEEYSNLRVTNIDPKVTNDELLDALEKMRRYGDLHVKIVNQRDPYGRIAYVNFERAQDARDARRGQLPKLVQALGRGVAIDPAGVVRDQEGRMVNSGGPSPSSGGGYRGGRDHYNDRGRGGGYRGGGGGGGGGYRDYRDRGGNDRGGYERGGGGGGYDRDRGYDDGRGYRGERR